MDRTWFGGRRRTCKKLDPDYDTEVRGKFVFWDPRANLGPFVAVVVRWYLAAARPHLQEVRHAELNRENRVQ